MAQLLLQGQLGVFLTFVTVTVVVASAAAVTWDATERRAPFIERVFLVAMAGCLGRWWHA